MKITGIHLFLSLLLLGLLYSCEKEHSFEGGPVPSGYLIKDPANNCSLIKVKGNYVAGKNITDSNFLQAQVYVNTPGRYTITSDFINGYSFTSSGNFNDTGLQIVKLPAIGIPLSTGKDVFNLAFGTSICQLEVTVEDNELNVVQVSNPDHFPLAENNHWSYDDLGYSRDSILRTISGNNTISSTTYKVMEEYISFFPATNEIYYRKEGSSYLEHVSVSVYTDALDYAPSLYDDMLFLKEDCHNGETWYSNTYSGHTSLGAQILVLRYRFRCIDADATVTINGKTFLHVIEMEMIPEVANPGENPVPTGEVRTSFYAKGVGLIYRELFNGIATHPELQIRSWVVN